MAIFDPNVSQQPPVGGTFGTSGNDSLHGTGANEAISGLDGWDLIYGYGGNDWLYGGDGFDTMYGGDQDDHLYGGDESDDLFGNTGNDWLYGGEGRDELHGGIGDDHLYGQGSPFHSFPGSNDSLLDGGPGADTLHGGIGVRDCADFANSASAVTVNLGTSTGAGGDAAGDVYYSIEWVTGSDFDDVIIGSGDTNLFRGGKGSDSLFGLGADDVLIGGEGADYLDGGVGSDVVSYTESSAAVAVNLATNNGVGGEAQGDTYFSIERVVGSEFSDSITGDANANGLRGGIGNDILSGGDGADTLLGDAGQDTLSGGAEADSFLFTGTTMVEYILDFSQAEGDKIHLQFQYGQTFSFIGDADFTGAAWQLRFEQARGETIVSGDVDGDGQSDFAVHCSGTINFAASDFLL